MDKIYLVVSGEYSDYGVHGFFADKGEAEKYCAYKNSLQKSWQDDYTIEECENLSKGFVHKDITIMYEHELFVGSYGNEIERASDCRLVSNLSCQNGIKKNKSPYRHYVYYNKQYTITVYLDEMNYEKAEKIAYDIYAKYKAEKEGL